MNKLLTKIVGVALGASMAIGVGVAVVANSGEASPAKAADSTVTFTMKNFGSKTANSYQNSAVSGTGSNSAGGTIAASAYAYNGSTGQVRGNKTSIANSTVSSDSNKNWHLFNTAAIPGAIKSIVVKSADADSSNYFKGTLYVALGTSSRGDVTTVSGATSATPTKSGSYVDTFTFSNLNASSSYNYFKVMSNVAFTNSSVKGVSVTVTYVETYSVTKNATNCTISGADSVDGSQSEEFTITGSTNYDAPDTITVKAGNTTLTKNTHYSYYVADYIGFLTVYKSAITGNLTITAAGVPQLTVTDSVSNGSLSSTSRIHSGEDLDISIVPASGYTYPTSITVTMGGSSIAAEYDSSDGTIYYTPVTGNIVVTATCPAAGNVYSITTTVTNGTYSGSTSITDNGGVASVTIAPTGDYKLPTSVSVSGAQHTYNSSNGVISLSNATGNVTISAAMVALTEYTITVNETNGSHTGASTIKESRSASLTFTPASGYGQPSSVTVSGATSSWTRGTGVLSLSNPTGNVTVTYVAVGNELDSISLSVISGNYTLGETFVKPTVTAHYTVAADANVTNDPNLTVTGYNPFETGNQAVTIGYTEGGITKTTSYTANVSVKSLTHTYNKISSVSDITEGDYILAYSSYGFDGRDAGNGYTSVTVSNNSITGSAAMDKLAVHIVPVSGGYTLQLSSTNDNNPSKYVSFTTNTNSLAFSDEAKTMSISAATSSTHLAYSEGGYAIGDASTFLSWNSNDGSTNQRFRFYKSSTTTNTNNNSGLAYKAPEIYKRIDSGTADLIRITATYTGGEKYVGDSISTSDFAVKKQLNTGNELIDVASGYTISANTLASTSNTITVSYTESNVEKTVDVIVPATERSATVTSVTLVQGENVVKDYVDWSGVTWNYTDLSVHCVWSDSQFNEDLSLADLIQSGDATVSPAKPSVGVTSFTVTYDYYGTAMTSNTVSGISVVNDYVTSISWTGTTASHFKAFSGGQLTAAQVGAWHVIPTFKGASTGSELSFNDYVLKVGSKVISSLPYTWASEDDGQELSITYGKDSKGNDFVKKNGTAVANICASINAIDHDEVVTPAYDEELEAYVKVTNVSDVTTGKYLLVYEGDSTHHNAAFDGSLSDDSIDANLNYQSVTFDGDNIAMPASDNFYVTITKNASDYTITTASGVNVGHSGTKNGFDKIGNNTISFNNNGTVNITGTGNIKLQYNKDTNAERFRYFASNQTSIYLYKYTNEIIHHDAVISTTHYANQMEHFDAQKAVVTFAKYMNDTMNGTNVCSGTFANLESAWDDVADKYDELFGSGTSLNETELAWAKNMLKYASAEWGSEAEAACVEKAMKTYEWCVSKHKLDPFMSDVRPVESAYISPLQSIANNANVAAVVIVISMITVTAVGGYFFMRKRKEQ